MPCLVNAVVQLHIAHIIIDVLCDDRLMQQDVFTESIVSTLLRTLHSTRFTIRAHWCSMAVLHYGRRMRTCAAYVCPLVCTSERVRVR